MSVPQDEHERTRAFAEIALEQIQALHQPAVPRNFEFWYHYATGYNPSFNQAVNERLAQKATLSEADCDDIYNTYVAPNRVTDRMDKVGLRVLDEIKQVLDMIDAAAGSATSYTESLAEASAKLAGAHDGEALRAVVERLIEGAEKMEVDNKKLEARLTASRQEIEQLQQNLEAARSESLIDPLTRLSNRKFFDCEIDKVLAEAKRHNEPLSLLMTDIDHFKLFNDQFGHPTGDQVLRLVALSVKQNVTDQDIAARYGGEEFAIALPKMALRSALALADHIRGNVMTKELMKRSNGERLGRVTVSIGVATMHANDTPQSLIERADACLYAAKRSGRNRVVGEAEAHAAQTSARVA